MERRRRRAQGPVARAPAGAPAWAGESNSVFSRALRRDVIVTLCLKAAALTLLYFLFFSHKPAVTPASVQRQLTRPQ